MECIIGKFLGANGEIFDTIDIALPYTDICMTVKNSRI
jgi:hypothetical protein